MPALFRGRPRSAALWGLALGAMTVLAVVAVADAAAARRERSYLRAEAAAARAAVSLHEQVAQLSAAAATAASTAAPTADPPLGLSAPSALLAYLSAWWLA